MTTTPLTVIVSLIVLAFGLVWFFLQIAAYCKIFEKAGESGWKALVPFYSTYIQYRLSWSTQYFSLFLVTSVLVAAFQLMEPQSLLAILFSLASSLAFMAVHAVSTHKLSKAFGHGIGFTLGLIFFEPIFALILAFGSSQYQGPQK